MIDNKKYKIIQLGCASNQADSIRIIEYLKSNKSEITNDINEANVIIVMSCGFSKKQYNETMNVIYQINDIKNTNLEIWVGGCIPAINKKFYSELHFKIDKYFTPRNFEELFNNGKNQPLKSADIQSLLNIKLNSYPVRILNGCNENCNYCVIKRAGGKTKSKSITQIRSEIKSIDKNITFISLVGEEIGSYGSDIGTNIFTLIEEILKIRPYIKISFSAIHPKNFIRDIEQYIKIYGMENITPILPIPIQSGSNKILELMNRDYLIEEVIEKINEFSSSNKNVNISTDIMVGYPGENWDDFLLTQKMVHNLRISALDCFKFDDMKGIGDTVSEIDKIKRLKIIALTFIRDFLKEKSINNYLQLKNLVNEYSIPINLNF